MLNDRVARASDRYLSSLNSVTAEALIVQARGTLADIVHSQGQLPYDIGDLASVFTARDREIHRARENPVEATALDYLYSDVAAYVIETAAVVDEKILLNGQLAKIGFDLLQELEQVLTGLPAEL